MVSIALPAEAAGMPDPGDALIERVTGTTSREFFYWSGRQSVHELKRTLAVADRPLESFKSILDFGCGCGRVELWLTELGKTLALHGTDIDEEAIAWARANIPEAEFTVNSPDPPLPFDEGAFDLVFNHSVFTHIDAERQDQWLSELHRIIRPGGMAVLSVHGERVSLKDPWAGFRDQLERDGIVFLADSLPADSPFPEWYQATLHAPWYIFEHWGQWFDIRALIPGGGLGHDHVLLERTTDERPRRTLAARPAPRDSAARAPEIQGKLDRAQRAHADAAALRSRFGRAGDVARQAVLRIMRPYTAHEATVDGALIDAVDELARILSEHDRRIDVVERGRTPPSRG